MKHHDRMLHLLAAQHPDGIEWASRGANSYINNLGDINLAQAFHCSNGKKDRKRNLRDHYIMEAAEMLAADFQHIGKLATPTQLLRAFAEFQAGPWLQWKALRDPPKQASRTQFYMFRALKAGAVPDTPQGLGKILRACSETNTA